MNTQDLLRLGVPAGEPIALAHQFIQSFIAQGGDGAQLEAEISRIVADPPAFFSETLRAPLARALYRPAFTPRAELAPWRQWGEGLEPEAVNQMANACLLPVAVAGALMPDAHVGYGLPIGGVLATENAVIPYAVGVDIACRMKLTVLDLPVRDTWTASRIGSTNAPSRRRRASAWARVQAAPAARGAGRGLVRHADHAPAARTRPGRNSARAGAATTSSSSACSRVDAREARAWARAGRIRRAAHAQRQPRHRRGGLPTTTASSRMDRHPELPKELHRLAWLSLDDATDGQEYWAAMELMGDYAAANHA